MINLQPESDFDTVHEAIVEAFEDDPMRGNCSDKHVEYRFYGNTPSAPATIKDFDNAVIRMWIASWTWRSFFQGPVKKGYTVIDATYAGEDGATVVRYVLDMPRDEREAEAMALLAARDHLSPIILAENY